GKAFRAQNVSGTDTYTFSPTLINNAQFTFSRTHAGVVSAAPFAWSDLRIPIAHTTPSELALTVSGFFSISSGHPGLFARQSYNFSDSVHWIRGGHELAMGFDYLKMDIDLINTFRQNGNFRFQGTGFTGNALSDFFLGYTQRFIQGGGEYAERRGTLASGFIQDNWKISRQLTVNIGLRYDPFVPFSDERGFTDCFRPGLKSTRFVNAPVNYIYAGDSGCPAGGTGSRWLQFAPRFGFSYDVTGKGKTVVRGGYGLFYQPPFVESFNNMVDSAPFSPQFIRFSVPFMDPFRGTQNPFPAQYGPQEPPKNVAFELPVTAVSYSGAWKPAQVQSWNIAVEHQVRADLLARVAYVGSKGTHLGYNTDLNAPPFGPGASADNIDDRRPYQNFATVIEDEAGATSIYNSLQATLEKRFSKNFSVLANYTWAKSIDTASFQTDLCGINIIDPFNIGLYRGPSDYDSKHRMVLSYLWQMPGFKDSSPLVRHALGGWESSGIWNWQSGFPLTITSADERSLTGVGNDNADYVGGTTALSPDRARGQLIQQYFNTSAFDLAKLGTFGSSGRGVLRGPGTFNIDFSAMKNFVVRERLRIQYRAEFFNLFNTPQFDNPDTGVADSRFGQITGARGPRIIQMAFKIYW
ncbi:MAG TPA: hypothetical protein VEU62_17995, partial [Bryobacterales bacterium]|nr:hypothetical protein [Bryobacterales bacterium]